MYLINVFVKNAKPNVKFPRMDALFSSLRYNSMKSVELLTSETLDQHPQILVQLNSLCDYFLFVSSL